jgi:hypothetical protein
MKITILAIALWMQNPDSIQELRAEIRELREQIVALRQQMDAMRNVQPPVAEEQELLKAKVDDQYQTKVESGSKYRVRLSGLALMNAFSTHGAVDNLDLPTVALPRRPGDSNGAFGASVRQSRLNLEVFGPEWKGAKTTGEVSFDFFGGFPYSGTGVTEGLVRLRTATLSVDGPKTSVVAGQDIPFFSPRSPTSLASSAYPPLSSAGNLWTWTPQIRVERRYAVSENDTFSVQGGILDPLTGEFPAEYSRTATAGERSHVPAFATRIGWQRAGNDHANGIGVGSYYSRQNWGFNRTVDAWAVTTDWDFALGRGFSLSGEFYRGRSIAGLGGSASGSVLFSNVNAAVLPLNNIGGWSQLKYKPVERLEFNTAFGEDQPFRPNLSRGFGQYTVLGSPVGRNASGFVNAIYTARSNLLFSVEYRKLWTSGLFTPKRNADQISITSGIAF